MRHFRKLDEAVNVMRRSINDGRDVMGNQTNFAHQSSENGDSGRSNIQRVDISPMR